MAAAFAVVAALLGWLWPIGLGGQMPLGGDVTQFFLGLMHFLGESLKSGRLPVWNDLWGYGFPGLGESQMGVYYPPHLVLYGLLATEQAYVLSLVLHTLWAGLGAWWAARRFGVSAAGAVLTALAFAASGFFVIHMPHPWGYTTGAWMPWALGLGWSILEDPSRRLPRRLFLLSLVLVLQVLPGHFQIAFMTQVVLLLMSGWSVIEASGSRRAWFAALAQVGCVFLVLPLAALQVWPTARLARLASAQRDFEYLSGFAATPLHFVSLVAPGLFHRSPLWRPLVWDPFHTSPEEMLVYVGLAPLCLALLTIRWEWPQDRGVRWLAILAGASILLSLGPYLPGFRQLILLPGFSFFRAPARWCAVLSLALAILAGRGLDGCRSWAGVGRGLLVLSACAVLWIGLVVGLVELAVASGSRSGADVVAGLFEMVFRARPWSGDPGFLSVVGEAGRPAIDSRIPSSLLRQRIASPPPDPRSFRQRHLEIYGSELAGTSGILAGLAGLALLFGFRSGRQGLPAGLMLLTIVDLGLLGRHRPLSVGPLAPLVEQSPVLAALAREPRGTRVIDGFRNLGMLAGLAPISAYRTLDLPALESITRLAHGPAPWMISTTLVGRAIRATGSRLRVLDPIETAVLGDSEGQLLDDPLLARCLFGDSWNQEQTGWGTRFRVLSSDEPASIAWFVPEGSLADPGPLDVWNGEPRIVLEVLDRARPLEVQSQSPSRLDVVADVSEAGWILLTQLADPQWRARWTGSHRAGSLEAVIQPTFRHRLGDGGWQRVWVPGPGRWTLHLEYDAADVRQGLALSAGSWLIWGCLLVFLEIRSRRRRRNG